MVNEFKVGHWYKLKEDYPELKNGETIRYEHDIIWWVDDKYEGFKNGKHRKAKRFYACDGFFKVEFLGVEEGIWNYHPNAFDECDKYGNVILKIHNDLKGGIIYNGDKKMELKNMKKINLKEAKKQVLEEKANVEIAEAKKQYVEALNECDRIDREIKLLKEERKEHEKVLKRFE